MSENDNKAGGPVSPPEIWGYAEEQTDGTVHFRGQYGREAYIPKERLDRLVTEFNKEVWNPTGNPVVGTITLRAICGSSGPADDFVRFYLNKA